MTERPLLAQEIFGANAAAYATSRTHAQGQSLQRLVELVQPRADWRMLDVATGAGHTALAFAPHVAAAVASDVTPEMLAQAAELAAERGLTNVSTQIADAGELPFGPGEFDLVTSRIAPHHFDDIQRFVNECARVLKSGGILAVVDNIAPEDAAAAEYIDDYERLRDPSHVRCLPASEWRACFERAGFRVTNDERINKRIGFDEWCDHQKAPDDLRARLREVLLNAAGAARAQLDPAEVDGALTFCMIEGLFVGRLRRKSVSTGTTWESMAGYARAVRIGNHVWVSGTTATDAEGRLVGPGDAAAQARFILQKIERALAGLGASLSDVVRTRVFVSDIANWEAVARAHGEVFGAIRPANTLIEARLVGAQYLVEIEADAFLEGGSTKDTK
jgi:ubiquinone/menaquinone biosynthesis C-methylase UbiE/enamine deaminase RidA (YjgF/YER057c/UK114 family)